MGNPESYLGRTLSWEGKQLTSVTDCTHSYSYSYNEDGLRLRKVVDGTDTEYYYNGSVLMYMITGSGSTAIQQRFSYDASGNLVAVVYKVGSGTSYIYYYLRNAQGDVVKMIDSSGNTVVEYTYDSWGKLIATTGSLANTVGANQPFRYRGYVYDEETEFYYLQSRYYDPNTCRFISADVYFSTGQGVLGHNSFSYCLNNPIRLKDLQGTKAAESDAESLILELIAKNVRKAKRHALSTYTTPVGLDPNAVQSMRTTQSIVELCKYAWFYFQVKKNGPMDYKVVSRWKKALPSLLFPGEISTYMFYGKKISASDLGNINYGAVGAAMGIPLNTLLKQAGAAQLRKPRIEHGEGRGFFSSLRRANQLGYFGHYGDQVDDFNNIILGYYLYLKGVFE